MFFRLLGVEASVDEGFSFPYMSQMIDATNDDAPKKLKVILHPISSESGTEINPAVAIPILAERIQIPFASVSSRGLHHWIKRGPIVENRIAKPRP